MNLLQCKRFQKVAGADFNALDATLLLHAEECEACADTLDEAQKFDALLSEAIKVAVPSSLVTNVLNKVEKSSSGHAAGSSRVPRYMAIAASVLLIVGAGLMVNQTSPQPAQSLEQIVLSHIEAEPEMLTLAGFESDERVKRQLIDFGIVMHQPLGNISHIELCDIGNTQGLHIVIKGEKGPVTLLLLPDVKSDQQQRLSKGRWVGYTEPAQRGTIAIVGEVGESLDDFNYSRRNSISWL